MIFVVKEKHSKEVSPENVSLGVDTPYGVWAYGEAGHTRDRLFQLIKPTCGSNDWHFSSITGIHSGYSNHNTCRQAIEHVLDKLQVSIPETKEELLNLMKEYLN